MKYKCLILTSLMFVINVKTYTQEKYKCDFYIGLSANLFNETNRRLDIEQTISTIMPFASYNFYKNLSLSIGINFFKYDDINEKLDRYGNTPTAIDIKTEVKHFLVPLSLEYKYMKWNILNPYITLSTAYRNENRNVIYTSPDNSTSEQHHKKN